MKNQFLFKMVPGISQSLQLFYFDSIDLQHDFNDLCRFSIGFGNYLKNFYLVIQIEFFNFV